MTTQRSNQIIIDGEVVFYGQITSKGGYESQVLRIKVSEMDSNDQERIQFFDARVSEKLQKICDSRVQLGATVKATIYVSGSKDVYGEGENATAFVNLNLSYIEVSDSTGSPEDGEPVSGQQPDANVDGIDDLPEDDLPF